MRLKQHQMECPVSPVSLGTLSMPSASKVPRLGSDPFKVDDQWRHFVETIRFHRIWPTQTIRIYKMIRCIVTLANAERWDQSKSFCRDDRSEINKKPTSLYLWTPVKRTRTRESLTLAELLHASRIIGCTASTGGHTAELPSRAQPTKVLFNHQLTSTWSDNVIDQIFKHKIIETIYGWL